MVKQSFLLPVSQNDCCKLTLTLEQVWLRQYVHPKKSLLFIHTIENENPFSFLYSKNAFPPQLLCERVGKKGTGHELANPRGIEFVSSNIFAGFSFVEIDLFSPIKRH